MSSFLILKLLVSLLTPMNILIFAIIAILLYVTFAPVSNDTILLEQKTPRMTQVNFSKRINCKKCGKRFNLKRKESYEVIEQCDSQHCPMRVPQLENLLATSRSHWGVSQAANDEDEGIEVPKPIVILTDKKGRDTFA